MRRIGVARAHARRQRRAGGARSGRAGRSGRRDHLGHRLDRLRPQRPQRRRAGRRLGTCPRRRGERLLDRPRRASRRAARGGPPWSANRADTASPQALRRFGGAEPDPRGLSERISGRPPSARSRAACRPRSATATRPRPASCAAPPTSSNRSASASRRRLGMGERRFRSSSAGGIFRAVPWLRDEMQRRLPLAVPPSSARVLDREPAAGAVSFAIQEAKGGARIPRYQSAVRRTPGPPRITVFPDDAAIARGLADRVARALAANPRLVLGLPTGRTPVAFYDELSTRVERGLRRSVAGDDFQSRRVRRHSGDAPRQLSHLHECAPVPPREPAAGAHSFSRTALRLTTATECARYERAIAAAGGIDVQILGIGTNGHIGFNEPAPALEARTHRVTLEPETRRDNAGLFGGDPVSRAGRSVVDGDCDDPAGASDSARRHGSGQGGDRRAGAARAGQHDDLPGSFLQLHPDVEIVLDEAAAAGLRAS